MASFTVALLGAAALRWRRGGTPGALRAWLLTFLRPALGAFEAWRRRRHRNAQLAEQAAQLTTLQQWRYRRRRMVRLFRRRAFLGGTSVGEDPGPLSHGSRATVAQPTASPGPGRYPGPVTVTMSCTTAGATVYCTVDGADPSAVGVPQAVVVLQGRGRRVVRAVAVHPALDVSSEMVAEFELGDEKG